MMALSELAIIYGQQNNAEQALAHLERAFSIAQEIGDNFMIASLQHDMAVQYNRFGNHTRALEVYQRLLKQMETLGRQGWRSDGPGSDRTNLRPTRPL